MSELRSRWTCAMVLHGGDGPLGTPQTIEFTYPVMATVAAIELVKRDDGLRPDDYGAVVAPVAVKFAEGDWRAFSVRVALETKYEAWSGGQRLDPAWEPAECDCGCKDGKPAF